eukprot:TRINITY_DN25988_c0_g1_i1.p1 TRINITY_DN25988_c0_g1~~TRINITY_DN25988_c0_g1_i1.p1  ORF type:complete len:743 (-),score=125.76 TRINITY_DN25988_c0_g1_i1:87-2315(-)
MGMIELAFSLLNIDFKQLQEAAGDVYPAEVRQLKADITQMLLALLEGRMDAKIHRTILQRGDAKVMRDRIQYVYRYYVFGVSLVNLGEVVTKEAAAVPLDSSLRPLMDPGANPTEVFDEMSRVVGSAEELLEDFQDEQLRVFFSEGFYQLQLVLEISAHDPDFEKEVVPGNEEDRVEVFVDNELEYKTKRDYWRAKTAYHEREVYRQSFYFLRRFVKTIEIFLNGHLQTLHFQLPITAMWYVQGASKQYILDQVPFKSPDIKMKAFVQMCQDLHHECRLILELSRFSILHPSIRKWAQRYLPDGLHRPFHIFLAQDARRMQFLRSAALYLSLILAIHTGTFIVPRDELEDGMPDLMWSSEVTERYSLLLGGLHFACVSLWLFLYTCIKVPLGFNYHKSQEGRGVVSSLGLALAEFVWSGTVSWNALLLVFCGMALFGEHWWLYSLLVADFFAQSPTLQTVLSGIVKPAQQLWMTFLGATIVSYVYAAIGMRYFRKDFGPYCDQNIVVCTSSILYMGTRGGIVGLSAMMTPVMPQDDGWGGRATYDVSYFIIFGIMLLNTIVALIVDSFQTLRREASAREDNLETQSFISCIDRKFIESVAQHKGIADGFHHHEEVRQPKWDYMAFIFYIHEKDVQDYTGPEQTIRQMLSAKDVQWLPIGRSKILDGKSDQSEEDGVIRVEKQNTKILGSLSAGKEQRQNLFRVLTNLTRILHDKTDAVQDSLFDVLDTAKATLTELEEQRKP